MIWSFPSTLKCKLGVACVASSGLAGGVIMNRSSELDVSAHLLLGAATLPENEAGFEVIRIERA